VIVPDANVRIMLIADDDQLKRMLQLRDRGSLLSSSLV